MRKLKRGLACILSLFMVFCLFSCDKEEPEKEYRYEIAMITESQECSIDDESYTQDAWEGLRRFAEENGKTYKYYEPAEASVDGHLEEIDEAVRAGAKVIACAGKAFEPVIYTAQEKYEDVRFILIDGCPADKDGKETTAKNTAGVRFDEAEAGYLAGYAMVKDGCTDLGFISADKSETAKNYGYGLVQGANTASKESSLTCDIKYSYTESGETAAKTQKKIENWYNDGVETVFVCGEDIFNSVAVEADIAGKKVIASDFDKNRNRRVVASAVKKYGEAMEKQLQAVYADGYEGGKNPV